MDNLYDLLDELGKDIYESTCLLECVEVLLNGDYNSDNMPDISPIISLCLKNNKNTSKIFDEIERMIYLKALKISE